jgi:Meckel syndrome type 1 protein
MLGGRAPRPEWEPYTREAMADKVDKPKKQKAKAKQEQKGVLGALPATRPERIGGRTRAAAPRTFEPTEAATAAATPGASKPAAKTAKEDAKPAVRAAAEPAAEAAAKPAAKAKPAEAKPAKAKPAAKAKAKPKPKPKASASRPKAAAPRTFEPTEAAEAAAGAADETTYPRPRAVSEGAPELGTPGYRDLPEEDEDGRAGGVELAATAVRAAGEVAQLGLALGGEVLKGVVKRLPRP